MQEAQAYADEKTFSLPPKTCVHKNIYLGFIIQYILVICSLSVNMQHLIF